MKYKNYRTYKRVYKHLERSFRKHLMNKISQNLERYLDKKADALQKSLAKQVRNFGKKTKAIGKSARAITLTPRIRNLAIGTVSAIAVGGAVAGGIVLARKLAQRGTFLSFPTKFGEARIYEVQDDEGQNVRLLEVGGIVQSGTYVDDDPTNQNNAHLYTDLVFEYLKTYDKMFQINPAIQRACVLGCGGYDYPKHLIADHGSLVVDAIEVDPGITSLARRYFYLDRLLEEYQPEESGRLNLIEDDAFAFLYSPGPNYDVIVNDTFDGGDPPEHLTTMGFYLAVKNRLNSGGLFLTNIVAKQNAQKKENFLHEQVELMKRVFENVEIIPVASDQGTAALDDEPDNVIVIARVE